MIIPWEGMREDVFLDRYALRQGGKAVESQPGQMAARVAKALATSPSQEGRFGEVISSFRFLPAGRVLAGAGAEERATYYNCFVLGIGSRSAIGRDSRRGIMQTMTDMVEILARGGGVGINWSVLRPEGSEIRGVRGISSGPLRWMAAADALADQIRQGGSRTAALMFMLDDWHPDIFGFIRRGRNFSRANYSVAVSDDFMRALRADEDWVLSFPDISRSPSKYDGLWDGDIREWEALGGGLVQREVVKARELWMELCSAAWATGNPGVVFLDRCNRLSTTSYLERLICTNPCGEQPLPEDGSCNLGAINLVEHRHAGGGINHPLLRETVITAVEMLDRVIDASAPITEEIHTKQARARRVGIGVMGLADLLLLEKIRYGSEESLALLAEVARAIRDTAYETSAFLAVRDGRAPAYRPAFLDGEFARRLPQAVRGQIHRGGIRNLALTSQAPTGTISILAGVSSGIEPHFAKHYVRRDATGEHVVRHPLLQEDAPWVVTASELTAEEHLRMQSTMQEYVDSAISKTINLGGQATIDDVSDALLKAYDLGCKGVTVYRDGSLSGQVLSCPAGEGKCE